MKVFIVTILAFALLAKPLEAATAMNKIVAPDQQKVDETQTVVTASRRRVEGRGTPFDGFFSIAYSGGASKASKVFRTSSSGSKSKKPALSLPYVSNDTPKEYRVFIEGMHHGKAKKSSSSETSSPSLSPSLSTQPSGQPSSSSKPSGQPTLSSKPSVSPSQSLSPTLDSRSGKKFRRYLTPANVDDEEKDDEVEDVIM